MAWLEEYASLFALPFTPKAFVLFGSLLEGEGAPVLFSVISGEVESKLFSSRFVLEVLQRFHL